MQPWKPDRPIYKIRERRYGEVAFPLKVMPLEDELLSSWLIRMALEHKTAPATFTNIYLPETKNKLWSADMDLQADPELLSRLSDKTGWPVEHFEQMTLKSYEGYLFEERHPKTGGTPFILPLCMRGRQITSCGIRFCPECLREDGRPYIRKKWRLTFSTACLKHTCFLIDKCPACNSPSTFYRRVSQNRFPCCDKCEFSFRDAEIDRINSASFGLQAIGRMYEMLDRGYVLLEGRLIYSFLFFPVINHLAKAVYFWDRTKGFLAHEVMRDRMNDLTWVLKAMTLEQIRLKEQYLLFSGLMRLFEDYPQNLLVYCRQNKFGKTEMTRDFDSVPFWLSTVLDELDQSFWPINSEEVASALRYMVRERSDITLERVKALTGRGIDFRKRKDIAKVWEMITGC